MDDLINDIKIFFEAQRDLYGSDIFLSFELADEIPDFSPSPVITKTQPVSLPDEAEQSELVKFFYKIKDCMNCPLGETRTNFVFGTGNPQADLMLVGEAPGRDEDLQGKPFVGRAGQLLTLMIQSIGLQRKDVFIANVLKCRPPNNRDPLPAEIEKCEPYLLKQIDLISPKLIVAMGRFAAASLLRTKSALGELRKNIHSYNNRPLIVIYHPAALLRNPLLKKQAWEDLKKIRGLLLKE